MHNNLFLNRLIVHTKLGDIAYDETYHKGINIIRGDNSSGKSTITQFIFYILGGAFNDWVKEAKRCKGVIAEVEMNGATMVFRRNITINPETNKANDKEPLYIYWGSLEELDKEKEHHWHRYSYNTTEDKKSYSNAIFENLDIPIVKGENNITIHQILRLLYLDQDSPTSSLFLYEQFDSTLTRETISDLLLGVYNQILYDQKQRKVDADRELEDVKREIKVIRKFVADHLDLVPSHLLTKIDNKQAEINKIETDIIALKDQSKIIRYTQKSKLQFEDLNKETIIQRKKVNDLDSQIRIQQYEIDDTEYFIGALQSKLQAIKNSILTRQFLGEFPLEYCPECLSDLTPPEKEGTCKLCKKPIDQSFGVTKARKIEQELSFQIKESNSIIISKKRELLDLKAVFDSEQVQLHLLQTKVNQALNDVKSYRDEKIDMLYIEKGFLEGEIIQYRTLLENAEIYQGLKKTQTELELELEGLNSSIKKLTAQQEQLKKDINSEIEKKALFLLNNDLRRQKDFIEAKEFHIDYRNNIAFISDKDAKYSASSNFYLKTAARFSIFFASLEIQRMRYPRFILCDNMEDKGIEKERAQNFQRLIKQQVESYKTEEYQIIYTTSFIPDELNNTPYCVGEFYTESNPTLKNV